MASEDFFDQQSLISIPSSQDSAPNSQHSLGSGYSFSAQSSSQSTSSSPEKQQLSQSSSSYSQLSQSPRSYSQLSQSPRSSSQMSQSPRSSSQMSQSPRSSTQLSRSPSHSPGSKRPASSESLIGGTGLTPPSPKRAGLECTVKVEAEERSKESPWTSGEGIPKGDIKSEESSPRRARLEREDSAAQAEREAQRLKREKQQQDRIKMKVLVSNFTEDQLDRYEMYRRAAFPRAAVRRLMQAISGTTISQNVVIAMAGIAKVFVGEIVEEALDVMEKCRETGPIQPKHIRDAVRKLRSRGALVNTKYRKKLFR